MTVDASDFRELAVHDGVHAGLITMPSVAGQRQRELMRVAIEAVSRLAGAARAEPGTYMINRVLEVEADGSSAIYDLPAAG